MNEVLDMENLALEPRSKFKYKEGGWIDIYVADFAKFVEVVPREIIT
jgi:hypothetical protein